MGRQSFWIWGININMITSEIASDTFKSKSAAIPLDFVGLKPNTTYSVFLDNVDASSIVKPWGKRLGDAAVSDASGMLSVLLLMEMPYEGTYSFDHVESKTAAPNKTVNQPKTGQNYHSTTRLFELRDGTTSIRRQIPQNILVIPGHTNRSEFHGH